jgi:signal transduction histidine kinase
MPEHVPNAQAEELRQMIIRLARLVEVSVTLNSTLDIRRLLQFIIDTAADLVDSEAASIMLVDENTHDLRFAAATGSDPDELAPIPVPLEGSIAGTIVREDRGLIINQVTGDPRHFRQVGERVRFQTRSLIGVPMRIRDRVTGVLEAVNKRGGDFSENDLQTLSIIASQAAVALHNARLVEALQRAYDELDKLDRMKRDFISIASHELRTPLGLILGYATILREEADPAASVHAEAVLNSALRMRALIEDMTNMNLMQAGSADVSLARHPLQPVIQAAQQEVAELVRAKGQRLTVRMPQGALLAMIDPPKLGRAVANLLNNAMRFTPAEGSLRLELERRAAEAWLRVADDGAGIPPDQLEAIFERFYQVEDHMTRRHGGMGLGLAIVRAIVRAHGGRVWAESEGLGRGATFTIALPLQPDPAPAAAGAASG